MFLPLLSALRCVLCATACLLAACATPSGAPTGATEGEVTARWGKPTAVHALPPALGARRLEYPQGGLEQRTWMVDFDADGRLLRSTQVRTFSNFMKIELRVDTEQTVRREFGTPWNIERYALSGLTAWMYPYVEAGAWNSVMIVLFTPDGKVKDVVSGPDPRFDRGIGRDD